MAGITVALFLVFLASVSVGFDSIDRSDEEGLIPGHPVIAGEGFSPPDGHCGTQAVVEYMTPGNLPGLADSVAWTFLFYDDAEFSGYDPLFDFANECRSSANVNVIVLQDDMAYPAFIYYVRPDGSLSLLEELGEVNMGDWETLQDFLSYGKTNFPADRYFLTMYDHGAGWWGACVDETSDDMLYMNEIQIAIQAVNGVDMLAFTAPCLMGALESAYELRSCVGVYMGSEDLSGYIFWRGIMDDIAAILDDSAALSNTEIGNMVIDLIESNLEPPYGQWATMCAVEQSQLQAMIDVFDELCVYMTTNIDDIAPTVQDARNQVWEMGMGGTYNMDEIDFYDFLVTYLALEDDPFVTAKLQEVMDLYEFVIINECHGSSEPRTNGLSINFPELEYGSQIESYVSMDLDFASNTGWDEFLIAFYDWQETGIEGGSDPEAPLTIRPAVNPICGAVNLVFTSPVTGIVTISARDISGRTIYTGIEYVQAGETSSYLWAGTDAFGVPLPSSIYIVGITDSSGDTAQTRVVMISR
ncbi:MAG: hypothetical protein K8S15_13840 [Candidatus Aegiribacteria sp.]|nr:hypothetical protein [Candidatus Aegiribacteria sp.]